MQKHLATDLQKLKNEVDKFSKEHNISVSKTIKLIQDKEEFLPIEIFHANLSPFETVVKYFREEKNKSFSEIASILNKEIPSCWLAYSNSQKKTKERLNYSISENDIPIKTLFSDKLSILELISCYLKDHYKLKFYEIARITKRDDRTIWTSYTRGKNKQKNVR